MLSSTNVGSHVFMHVVVKKTGYHPPIIKLGSVTTVPEELAIGSVIGGVFSVMHDNIAKNMTFELEGRTLVNVLPLSFR